MTNGRGERGGKENTGGDPLEGGNLGVVRTFGVQKMEGWEVEKLREKEGGDHTYTPIIPCKEKDPIAKGR